MQVARQRESTRRKFLILEIVSGVEGNAPLGRQVHAAVEAERLNHRGRQPRFGIAEAVVEPDVPRDIEVVIARRHHLPPGIGVQIVEARLGEHVGVLGRRSAPAVDVVHRGLRRRTAVPGRVERVTERSADARQPPQFAAPEHEAVDTSPVGVQIVRVERGADVEPQVLDEGRAQRDRKGSEIHRVGQKIVRGADAQVVDHLDFPYSGSIAVVPYLHLERLGEAERDRHAPSRSRHAVKSVGKGRVLFHVSERIALHPLVIAVLGIGEVGRVVEAHGRRQHVADRPDQAVLLLELEHAVDLGRTADRETIVVQAVEARRRISGHIRFGDRVPHTVDLTEVPTLLIVGRRTDVQIVEQIERSGDRNLVIDTVLHLLEHRRREQGPLLDRHVVA